MKTSDQDECVLCCREISIYAVGVCDHPVCYDCSARMRVLCETNECPICRSNMPMVICTYEPHLFSDAERKISFIDKKYQIAFENLDLQNAFQLLLQNGCMKCSEIFHTFHKLKEHVRRQHDLHYCELCSENLKIFPFERKVYNRKELARHKRVGDPEDTSHRGHPLCEFCDQRYVDSDELFRHLRKEHYFCHFCDADGKHQYYENYEYLRVHFRKEHYLCEEGDCINEKFIGAFRTEIDFKAHIAVHHIRNKSKAEVRQARTLEFEFTYAHTRPNGSSSPRGGRYHQHKRQNIEEETKSRENKAIQQAEVEKINTQSTLEFPYLSEDGENRSNHATSVPVTNLNSVTLQSFNRNPVPQRPKNAMSADEFPALTSTNTVSVLSASNAITNNQGRKLNINRQNATVRTSNLSIQLSQKGAPPKCSENNVDSKDADNKQAPSWIGKKISGKFEDDFPRLESKKTPVTYTNVVSTAVVSNVQSSALSATIAVANAVSSNGDNFVVIKSKGKKKKNNKAAWIDNKDVDENSDKEEPFSKHNLLLSNNNFNLLDQDPFKKNLVRQGNTYRDNNMEEETWLQKASFGKDDFPPLAPSEVIRKPSVYNVPKKKAPPPGFHANSDPYRNSAPLNISLSSVARQLVASDKSQISQAKTKIPYSDKPYKHPPNFHPRNEKLIKRIEEISNAQKSVFNEFKTVSGEFRQNKITASDYHTKCLEILKEKGFCDIFPELISLLPDINKQQELLDVHRRYQSCQNNSGAVPKQKLLNNNQVSVCDTCNQVLLESDYSSHVLDHDTQ